MDLNQWVVASNRSSNQETEREDNNSPLLITNCPHQMMGRNHPLLKIDLPLKMVSRANLLLLKTTVVMVNILIVTQLARLVTIVANNALVLIQIIVYGVMVRREEYQTLGIVTAFPLILMLAYQHVECIVIVHA